MTERKNNQQIIKLNYVIVLPRVSLVRVLSHRNATPAGCLSLGGGKRPAPKTVSEADRQTD